MREIKTLGDLKERLQTGFENNEESLELFGKTYSTQLKAYLIESQLAPDETNALKANGEKNEKLAKDILLSFNEREIVESVLNRSKLKEKDVEEIDSLIKNGLFQMYYQIQIGSAQIGD